MRVKTWIQDTFTRPEQTLQRKPGDFYSIDDFIPTLDGQQLQLAPSWSSHITYPSNFKEPRAAFYDEANDKFVIIGANDLIPAGDLVGSFSIAHDDLSKSSAYAASSSPTDIGGTHKLNAQYVFSGFWFVGSDGDVYRAAGYAGDAASNKYGSGDARAIIPIRDTIYLATDTDEILWYNTGTGAFETVLEPWYSLAGEFLCHYRNEIILLAYHNDGSLSLYRIDDLPPAEIRQIARLSPHTGQRKPDDADAQYATPWALYDDDLYFSPGAWIAPSDDFNEIPLYRFTGSRVELVDVLEADVTPHAWGLVQWRERLLLYLLDSGDQRFYLLHNDTLTQFMSASYTLPTLGELYSAGGHLLMITTVSATDGVSLTQNLADDAVFTTAWLDMGHPTAQKHLVRLAAIVSDAVSSFNVKIEYRTEGGSWTEAVEEDNARHVDAGDIGVDFYLLQIRVTFTDSTGNDQDVRLESLAATYSYGVP